MDEENGFMIQCEECLCWQHSACMGLLEESIPEQYVCYVCRDPPGINIILTFISGLVLGSEKTKITELLG